eukprot:gene84-317_t
MICDLICFFTSAPPPSCSRCRPFLPRSCCKWNSALDHQYHPRDISITPASRLKKKILATPGLFAKEGGLGDRLKKRLPKWYFENLEKDATPWMLSGEATTMVPYFASNVLGWWGDIDVTYYRIWVRALAEDAESKIPLEEEEDGEVLAVDWAFPSYGYDESKPVLIVLHGLNGGSHTTYVRDLVKKATKEGMTCCCFSGRGISGLPMHKHPFHGARVADVHLVAKICRQMCPKSLLIATGFSMGGIVVSSYASKMGDRCLVDAICNVAGCIDINHSRQYEFAQSIFTPLITYSLKMSMLLMNTFEDVAKQCDVDYNFVLSSKCNSLTDFDSHVMRKIASYKSVEDYYD